MSYNIVWSDSALKQLGKLDRMVARRIWSSVGKLKENPYRHVKKVVGDESFRFRVGDYRIFLDIDNQRPRILILKIDHRSTAYKHM